MQYAPVAGASENLRGLDIVEEKSDETAQLKHGPSPRRSVSPRRAGRQQQILGKNVLRYLYVKENDVERERKRERREKETNRRQMTDRFEERLREVGFCVLVMSKVHWSMSQSQSQSLVEAICRLGSNRTAPHCRACVCIIQTCLCV